MEKEEKFVIIAAEKLKDAVEMNKIAGFSLDAITESVKFFFDNYQVDKYIYPENAGWIKEKDCHKKENEVIPILPQYGKPKYELKPSGEPILCAGRKNDTGESIPPPVQTIKEGENLESKKIKSLCCNADIWGEGGHQCERIHRCSKCKKIVESYFNQAEPPPPPPPSPYPKHEHEFIDMTTLGDTLKQEICHFCGKSRSEI